MNKYPRLIHCRLGVTCTRRVVASLQANNVLEELHLSNNQSTDSAISSIVDLLNNPASNIRVLALANNQLTAAGSLDSSHSWIYHNILSIAYMKACLSSL